MDEKLYPENPVMDDALVQAYNEQSKYVVELEERLGRYEQYAAIRSDKGKTKERRQRHFVKVYKVTNCELRRKKMLTQAEKAVLFDIVPFANYETNVIVDGQGIPMNVQQIGELCGYSKPTIVSTLETLEAKGLLHKIKHGRNTYVRLDEDYFECGRYDSSKVQLTKR